NNTADTVDDLFLFGDDCEAILALLQNDEAIEEQFAATVGNAQSADVVCSDCGKQYKTRGGYQSHRAAKRNPTENERQEQATLTPNFLAEIVHNAIRNGNKT
ncbi:uncharacterized protein LOC110066226, partial [Orbicella faveolata]|uniref:uncharacterized protein LOC110066226 n=1 Tax=Orbicella faveolata TaxID=48498 RepID=UPI0009E4C59E